ncbi:MAG: hypothetical protein WCB90_02060 [Methanosarcina sp.]
MSERTTLKTLTVYLLIACFLTSQVMFTCASAEASLDSDPDSGDSSSDNSDVGSSDTGDYGSDNSGSGDSSSDDSDAGSSDTGDSGSGDASSGDASSGDSSSDDSVSGDASSGDSSSDDSVSDDSGSGDSVSDDSGSGNSDSENSDTETSGDKKPESSKYTKTENYNIEHSEYTQIENNQYVQTESEETDPSIGSRSKQAPPSASVSLHGEKTEVVSGEDILLKLSAVNLITKPTMHVQVIIIPPSGTAVSSSEFVQSGAGQYTTTYELEPGQGRDIEVRIESSQVGNFNVKGRVVYYFGEDIEKAEDYTLELPIQVKSTSEFPVKAIPGFGVVTALSVLLGIFILKREKV